MLACFFLITWGHHLVENLGNLFFLGDVYLNRWSFPLTAFAVLGFINAMNMIDGQDGLAGGIALCQTALLLILNILLGNIINIMLLAILCVLLITFLLFNMPLPWRNKANVFLGDAGSTFIAFVIAWFATDLAQTPSAVAKPITILWILAMPLFDLISVCAYRIFNGVSPFTAGRDHLHHILHMRGINTIISTFLMWLLALAFGIAGILLTLSQVSEGWMFVGYLGALACYLLFVKVVREKST
jgi:UDP-GlcNAc:undecaprenyl-phosphate GlcNAc-1-phosphate transferase